MPSLLPALRLTGATILRDGAFQARSLAIAGGRIARGPHPEVDLRGYLILPGIVDLHGMAPPPGPISAQTRADWLDAAHSTAARAGVTTGWLTQGWGWAEAGESPEESRAMAGAMADFAPHARVDLRLKLSVETHSVATGAALISAVQRFDVDYVTFRSRVSDRAVPTAPEDQALGPRIALARAETGAVPRHLCRLADAFDDVGVLFGSHGDLTGEAREMFSMIGARIAEFPANRRAAAAASAMGDPVVLPAPMLFERPRHADRPDPAALLAAGIGDALASGGDPATLARAAFALTDSGAMDLSAAWALISTRPAEILRLADRGHLTPGRRADLVILHAKSRAIEATISGGRLAYVSGGVAARFMDGAALTGLAAE